MNKIKLFFKGLFLILLYFILSIGIYLILYNHVYHETNIQLSETSKIFSDLLILFIFIIIFRKKLIPDYYNFKKNYKSYLKENYKWWLLGLFFMVVSNILISFITNDLATNEEINREILLLSPVSSIISMVITGPIIEELITRKIFKDIFKNQYIYIIISGLIFGSLHLLVAESLMEILYIIPYGVLGCAFAKIYYDTDNLWVNIFFHALHNLIAILLLFGV